MHSKTSVKNKRI